MSVSTHLQFFWGVVSAVVQMLFRASPVVLGADGLMERFSLGMALYQKMVPCYLPVSETVCFQWLLIVGRGVKGWGCMRAKLLASGGTILKDLQVQHSSLNPLFQPHCSLTSPSAQRCFLQPLWSLLLNTLPAKHCELKHQHHRVCFSGIQGQSDASKDPVSLLTIQEHYS